MNDEFYMVKTISAGSNGGNEVSYNLSLERLPAELNGITLREIIRLNDFLTEYIKQEGGRK